MSLNPTSASLLGLLADVGETTGADLLRVAQLRIGDFWNLTRSQVYRELGSLAGRGYVRAGPPGPRESRPYRITAKGEAAFRDWLADTDPANQVRLGLLVVVAFGRYLPPGRLQKLLDEFEDEHRRRLGGYRILDQHLAAQDADPYVRATLSFGVHYEEAVLRWLESLPADVRDGTASDGG